MIGIIVAMDKEFALMRNSLTNITTDEKDLCIGNTDAGKVVLVKSGIGKVNSTITACTMIKEYAPEYIINSGVAVGIDRSLNVGDVVVGEHTAYHDFYVGDVASQDELGFPALIPSDAGLLAKAREVAKSNSSLKFGLICTGDQFITNNDALMTIKNKLPEALAVDMESCSIAHTCHRLGVPFMSIRIISDTPWVDHHAAQYNNFWATAPEKLFDVVKRLIGETVNR